MKRRKPRPLRKTGFMAFRTTEQERRYIVLAAAQRGQNLTDFLYAAAMDACQTAGVFARSQPQAEIETARYTQQSFEEVLA